MIIFPNIFTIFPPRRRIAQSHYAPTASRSWQRSTISRTTWASRAHAQTMPRPWQKVCLKLGVVWPDINIYSIYYMYIIIYIYIHLYISYIYIHIIYVYKRSTKCKYHDSLRHDQRRNVAPLRFHRLLWKATRPSWPLPSRWDSDDTHMLSLIKLSQIVIVYNHVIHV